jgi:hypothetical protein
MTFSAVCNAVKTFPVPLKISPKISSTTNLEINELKAKYNYLSDFLGTLGTFEKSDFSQKNRIYWAPWARFEKSDFSQKSDLLGAWARF